ARRMRTTQVLLWCNPMSDRPEVLAKPRSSRQRYRGFVQDYQHGRLDEPAEPGQADTASQDADTAAEPLTPTPLPGGERGRGEGRRAKRRVYLRQYLGWLWPHRYAVATVFVLALLVA